MIRFRAATYNIHRSRGMDWRVRPTRIAKVLRELEADVIALQEVVGHHVAELSEAAGMQHVFGPAGELDGHDYGNAVLSRFPILQTTNYDISVPGREHRRCLRADLDTGEGRVLHFFAVHLGTSFFERRHQALHLISHDILRNPNLTGARLMAGDFNEWLPGLTTKLLSQHAISADVRTHLKHRRTYPGLLPFLHLDHFYFDASLKVRAMHLQRTRAALMASDHLPLIADFEQE